MNPRRKWPHEGHVGRRGLPRRPCGRPHRLCGRPHCLCGQSYVALLRPHEWWSGPHERRNGPRRLAWPGLCGLAKAARECGGTRRVMWPGFVGGGIPRRLMILRSLSQIKVGGVWGRISIPRRQIIVTL